MKNILAVIGGATVIVGIFKAGRIYGILEVKKIIEETPSREHRRPTNNHTSYRDYFNKKEGLV